MDFFISYYASIGFTEKIMIFKGTIKIESEENWYVTECYS